MQKWMAALKFNFNFLFIFAEKQTTSETQKSVQCGTWTKHAEGGVFTSPNYPSKYPPDRECIYIIEGKLRAAGAAGKLGQAWPLLVVVGR